MGGIDKENLGENMDKLKKWYELHKSEIEKGKKRIKNQFLSVGLQIIISVFFLLGMLKYILPNLGYHIKEHFIIYLSIILAIFLSRLTYSENKSLKENLKKYTASFIIFNAVIIILLIIPIFAGDLSFSLNPDKEAKEYDWLSFFGNYFGIIITAVGILIEIIRREKEKKENERQDVVEKLKNDFDNKVECFEILVYHLLKIQKIYKSDNQIQDNEENITWDTPKIVTEILARKEYLYLLNFNVIESIFYPEFEKMIMSNFSVFFSMKYIEYEKLVKNLNDYVKENYLNFNPKYYIQEIDTYIYENELLDSTIKSYLEIIKFELELIYLKYVEPTQDEYSEKKILEKIDEIIYDFKELPFDYICFAENRSIYKNEKIEKKYIYNLGMIQELLSYEINGFKFERRFYMKLIELKSLLLREGTFILQCVNSFNRIMEINTQLIELGKKEIKLKEKKNPEMDEFIEKYGEQYWNQK